MTYDNQIITLDDNQEYTIVFKVNYEGNNYIYLANINVIPNYIIGRMDGDEIVVVDEEPLLSILILKFAENIKQSS